MIWSEMAVRLRTPGQGTDMVHRIVEALRDEISAGSLAGGSRITGEKELSAILGVSRSTLREALRILVHEGLLVSRWGIERSKNPYRRNAILSTAVPLYVEG